jgi:hypothetical protein
VTHFSGIGNAKRKRTEKSGFIGGFEGFGGDEGKRRLLNADCWPGAGTVHTLEEILGAIPAGAARVEG